jgi:O-methyltransferase involved in polyketide biosynthesis
MPTERTGQPKVQIKLRDVQESLLMPLWSRAKFTEQNSPLISDPNAVEIISRIDYDFSHLDRTYPFGNNLLNVVRALHFDAKIRSFITTRPRASIINVGAGLDTTFYRIDNGLIQWYDLDLPDVIELRTQLIPRNERVHLISSSMFDPSWYGRVERTRGGIFAISGGVLFYFNEFDVKSFLTMFADNFPGAEIAFDTVSRLAAFLANWTIRRTGMKNAVVRWALKNACVISRWDGRLQVVDHLPFFKGVSRDPSWGRRIRGFMDTTDKYRLTNIVHLRVTQHARSPTA